MRIYNENLQKQVPFFLSKGGGGGPGSGFENESEKNVLNRIFQHCV